MIKDKLQIFLVTYNRADKLEKTFEQIFAPNSPIKDFDISVLDNNSTDGTVEIIKKYQQRFKNLKHLRHRRNIGANANIARAYEEANKDYVWILSDDDNYDFSNWSEVEAAVIRGEELIMVSKYALAKPTYELIHIVIQATFNPAVILSTKLLDDTTLRNMYDNIYTMYVQLVPVVMALNDGKQVYVLNGEAIVHNGDDYGSKNAAFFHDPNYHRGANADKMWFRSATMSQPVGLSNSLEPLKIKEVKETYMHYALYFFKPFEKDFIHFADIWANLNKKQKKDFVFKLLATKLRNIVRIYKSEKHLDIKIFGLKTHLWKIKRK